MFFVVLYPVGVLGFAVKLWESVTVCRHIKKEKKKKQKNLFLLR